MLRKMLKMLNHLCFTYTQVTLVSICNMEDHDHLPRSFAWSTSCSPRWVMVFSSYSSTSSDWIVSIWLAYESKLKLFFIHKLFGWLSFQCNCFGLVGFYSHLYTTTQVNKYSSLTFSFQGRGWTTFSVSALMKKH